MIKKFSLLLVFIIAAIIVKAQDSPFRPLLGNAQIIEYRKHLPKENTHINNRTQSTSTVSLLLPFYDEFSYAGPYPDPSKWQNSQSVYVNRTKAIAPPTLGVATFDGLNKFGYPYIDNQTIPCSNNGNSLGSFASDTLTSLPIRLDSLGHVGFGPVDSMYLSFYYQPMGYYEAPETNDNLYLDFYSPMDTTWNNVWLKGGTTPIDSAWHLVMIPITDTSYFHKNFQFRFRNLSSASGDVDHWHLDVVSLNNQRSYKDTIFPDKSFAYDLPSTLKNYTQMPYNQYSGGSDMKTHIGVCLRNNDNAGSQNVGTEYSSFDNTHGTYISPLHTLASANLPYYYGTGGGYSTADSVVKPSLNFAYPHPLSDTISYTMKFFLSNSPDTHPGNDTISFTQKFDRYYAYDDGSAEAGYSICGEPVAVKYKLNVADSIRAMDIFFDPIFDVKFLESTSFKIAVWGDNGGLPSNTPLYTDSVDRYPYFPADTIVPGTQRINSFLRYQFLHPVYLAAGSVFYIGVIPNSNTTLSIGLDRNNTFYQNMFRYVASNINQWFVFAGAVIPDWDGALMLHPVFGSHAQTLSIKDYTNTNKANFTLYPNPAEDFVTIKSEENINQIVITDILGNIILQQTSAAIKTINTLSLQSGVYLIKAFNDKGFADTQKLIIAK